MFRPLKLQQNPTTLITLKAFAQKGSSIKEDTGDITIVSLCALIAVSVAAVVIISRKRFI